MSIFDKLSQGMTGGQQSGGSPSNWNDMVGVAPPEHFGNAVGQAMQQVDPQDYYNHTQPGVGGTDPFGQMSSPERSGLGGSLLGALLGRGHKQDAISNAIGMGGGQIDPSQLSPGQLAQMSQWAQRNDPGALGQVAVQHKDNPGMLQSLLGNKAVQMAAVALGAKLLMDHHNG